ncbi:hypothetical protein MOQ72_21920 [Saccharopolyspora sp. K220]|uniref:hypothetical protein n=1 Tax=Saccharopolyspora soli TaxID=2926618 RepID=UPI001F57642C|nr:hypothetical protein [Saccharopolyspora soli]MCI2420104.1 hypothetical protein [Saccharopolyspora soli]
MPRLDPFAAEELLLWFVERDFARHVIGPPGDPRVIVLFHCWADHDYIDVAHVRGEVRTEVARVVNNTVGTVYQPRWVVWHYWGGIVDALEALRNLPDPGHPNAPTRPYQPPRDLPDPEPGAALWITHHETEHVRIRLPQLRF